MKTGIELIAEERQEQLEKHKMTIEQDVKHNSNGQLRKAACTLLSANGPRGLAAELPKGWDVNRWRKMINKNQRELLITAGALIAAELDRIQSNPQSNE